MTDADERKYLHAAYARIDALVLDDIDRNAFVGTPTAPRGAPVDVYRAMMNEGARILALRIHECVRLGREHDTPPEQTTAVSETARGQP